MEWLAIGFVFFIAFCVFSAVIDGAKDRRSALHEGRETGSLYWHIQEAVRKDKELRKQLREQKKKGSNSSPASGKLDAYIESKRSASSDSKHWRKETQRRERKDTEPPPARGQTAPEPVPEQTSAPKPQADPSDSGQRAPDTGNLVFVYEDSRGEVSTRALSSWTLHGEKLRGFCLDREAIRTFKLDRIVRVIEGEDLLEASRRAPARTTPPPPDAQRKGVPEVMFSGFDAKSRQELESTAESHGFMVRKSVTRNLDLLVAGPRPSQSKLADAKEKPGCSVTDKEGFLWMVATGEIPA